jgi:uracil-DNA glycosylase
MSLNPTIDSSWLEVLQPQFESAYFLELKERLVLEKSSYTVFPPGGQIFAAFNKTPFNNVKVVILGQDPYHGAGQANGLCFSVADGIPMPPSLINIFKELNADLNVKIPGSGNLEKWADQGVLMLNATLTVRANTPNSHSEFGWQIFTDAVISQLNEKKEHLVFILWGKFAQGKEGLIDSSKHCILKAAHPSPFSAYNGFFGCRHFSAANNYLSNHGIEPVEWSL